MPLNGQQAEMQWEGRARAALGQPEIPDADLSEVFGKLPPRQVGMGACLEELFFAAQRCKPPRAWPNPLAEAAHSFLLPAACREAVAALETANRLIDLCQGSELGGRELRHGHFHYGAELKEKQTKRPHHATLE